MIFNVAQLLKEGIGTTRDFVVDGSIGDLDECNPGPNRVMGKVGLLRTSKGILARGSARLKLVQLCRRCLEPIDNGVSFEFEEEFIPSIDVETGDRLASPNEESPELVIDQHHTLNLTEVLRQHALLAASELALCAPDCMGLCPGCGSNLNVEQCHCHREEIDPRLAVLAELLASPERREQSD